MEDLTRGSGARVRHTKLRSPISQRHHKIEDGLAASGLGIAGLNGGAKGVRN